MKALFILPVLLLYACAPVSQPQDSTTVEVTVPQETEQSSYTLSDVAMHSTADDCWLAINGKVYDMTEFIGMHPGGEALLEGCGRDATTLYETRPMGSGTPHSDKARNRLDEFYIGELK